LRDYRGQAWYETEFGGREGQLGLLRFDGVCYYARVWLNGRELGSHAGGFSPFSFPVRLQQRNRLVVNVDNRWGEEIAPGAHELSIDWMMHGGIAREVRLEELPEAFVEDVRVMSWVDGRVKAAVLVRNAAPRPTVVPLSLVAQSGETAEEEVKLADGEGREVNIELRLRDPMPWNVEEPHLHEMSLAAGSDERRLRIGLREISAEGPILKVNGREVFLRGVNRHDDHPDWGHSIPAALLRRDFELVRKMGCNAIRGAHYPPDELLLDLCDEHGVAFLEEIPAYQLSAAQLGDARTASAMKELLDDMVSRDFNHPSVLAWGLLNEGETDKDSPKARANLQELANYVRQLDPTRPVTYFSAKGTDDKCFDLADVVCFNEYLGWYRGKVEDARTLVREVRELHPRKPLLVTEFGAGAIEGFHSLDAVKWSEEGQEKFLRETMEVLLETEGLSGCFVWQMADVDVVPERAMQRPRRKNNKGVLTGDRRPKLAFWTVKRLYEEKKHGG